MCVQLCRPHDCTVLIQMSVNIGAPSQQCVLHGINGKVKTVGVYFIYEACIIDDIALLSCNADRETAAFYTTAHLGTAYSCWSWRYHF